MAPDRLGLDDVRPPAGLRPAAAPPASRARRRLPLRVRATVAFALTAAILSGSLALVAFALVRRAVVDDRESQAMRQTYTNARVVRNGLRAARPDIPRLLSGLQFAQAGGSLLEADGEWYTSSVDLRREVLPADLIEVVAQGRAGRLTVRNDDGVYVAVGVPIVEAEALYFETFPLTDVEQTLDVLARSLLVAGLAATVVGGVVGASASGAVLRPIKRIATIARDIVAGDLGKRLEADGDPDLEPLAVSFNEMLDDLRDRIQREARFASDVTHELRGPLATLASAVEVVNRRRDQLPEQAVLAVDAMASQVASFNQLVLDLLEISRFDAGAAHLDVRKVDLAAIVRAVCDEQAPTASITDDGVTAVMADPRRVQQVIANLVQNADRYAGGITDVEVVARGDRVRVTMSDRGPGVADEEKEAIFGRFSRGVAAQLPDAPRGTGLGLALASEHVALHGGHLWVADRPGGGASFVIELPAGPS